MTFPTDAELDAQSALNNGLGGTTFVGPNAIDWLIEAARDRNRLAAELETQKEYTHVWNERCNRKVDQLVEAEKRCRELEAELARVTKEREEARAWVRRMHNDRQVLTCAFCGVAYPPLTQQANDATLAEHIRVCEKHPMRAVETERDAAKALALELWAGLTGKAFSKADWAARVKAMDT